MASFLYLFSIGLGLIALFFYLMMNQSAEEKGQKIMLLILTLVFVMEFIGNYTGSRGINNSLLYNFGWVYIESLLLIYFYFQIENMNSFKYWIKIITLFILIFGVLNAVFFQDITSVFQYFTFLAFAIFIMVLSIRFLKRVLEFKIFGEKSLVALPHFWISVGILFFYAEAIIYLGIFQVNPQFVIENILIFSTLNRFLAGLMYLFFGFSFFFSPFIFKEQNEIV